MVYAALMISLYTMSHYNGLCCLNDIFAYHESLQWFMLPLHEGLYCAMDNSEQTQDIRYCHCIHVAVI